MGRSSTTRRGPLPAPEVRSDDQSLTRFAGMLPFIRFCSETLELPRGLLFAAPRAGRARKHARHHVLFAFLIAAVLGTERLTHLELLADDPLLLKLTRLSTWPVRKVFSKALADVTDAGVAQLLGMLCSLGVGSLPGDRLMVLDFDSTAIICFGEQDGAEFGYNGKGRNRRRHYPLIASVAGSRAVVHANYRDGSGIDADEYIAFFKETISRVRAQAGRAVELMIRADSGFWSAKVCAWFLAEKIPFACSLPLGHAVKLLLMKTRFAAPDPDDNDLQTAVIRGPLLGYAENIQIVVIRRRVLDLKAPPPGKVVHGDTRWRYQAIVSSLDWDAVDVWRFYNDRGDCERVFKTGKHALGLGCLIGQDFRANEVAFLLRLIAFNADLLFQRAAEQQARDEGRPVVRLGLIARQPRFFCQAGRLLREHNRWVLRVPKNRHLKALWTFYGSDLIRPD